MQRIKYYDTLRFLAIFGVIALHVFQTWPNATVMNIRIDTFSEIFKFAVPVFLMISGALLLNRDITLDDFFKRRFARLTYPFILYLILYAAVLFILMSYVTGFGALSKWLVKIPFQYNWYFWTIASLYLAVPVINKFVKHSSIREIEYFIAVVLVGSIFYQVTLLLKMVHYIDLNLFISPIAYLILGYWLSRKDFKLSTNKIITIAVIFFIGSTLFKMSGHVFHIPMQLIENYEATRSMILASYIDMGFMQIVQASSLFVILRYLYESKDGIYSKIRGFLEKASINRFILSVSMASYGMYLFHHTLIEPLRVAVRKMPMTGFEICLSIVVLSVVFFIVSWIVVLIIDRIPLIGRFSGYH